MHRSKATVVFQRNFSFKKPGAIGSQLKSRNVESELKELRFLISNIANNVNQMARHSNTVKHVADDNAVFQRLSELDQLIVDFTDTRLRSAP